MDPADRAPPTVLHGFIFSVAQLHGIPTLIINHLCCQTKFCSFVTNITVAHMQKLMQCMGVK